MKLAALFCFAAACATAQKLELKFDALAAKAAEKSEVDLDGPALAATGKFAGIAPASLSGIAEVHVRAYEFADKGAYSTADLEPLRKQVGPNSGWSRIVSVKEKTEEVEVYLHTAGGKTGGLLVIAAEQKELSVVHILGDLNARVQEIVKSDVHYDLKSLLAAASAKQPDAESSAR